MKLAALGVALTAAVTALVWLVWGGDARLAALAFGLLATVLHVAAVALLRPAVRRSFRQLATRWAVGMGLRLGGAALLAVAIIGHPAAFPPLPTAVAYLGVLVPLLFTEMRFLK